MQIKKISNKLKLKNKHLSKMNHIPLHIFYVFAKDQGTISVWFYFWVFSSIPLINMSVSVLIPYSLCHYCSVPKLEVRDVESPSCSFIVKNCFHYLQFLFVHVKLRIALFVSLKNLLEICEECIECVDWFW